MLKEATVKHKEEIIETSQARLDVLTKEHAQARTDIAECRNKIKTLRMSIEQEERTINELQGLQNTIKLEHQPLVNLVFEERELLEQDAFDKKVQGFIDEHTGFYQALEARLIKLQDEYKETMALLFTFVEPKNVIASIRSVIEAPNSFSHTTNDYRQAKLVYEQNIREICTVKANGGKPSFQAAKSISRHLDIFLETGNAIDLWHNKL
jgi:chromosome segregation ATPase